MKGIEVTSIIILYFVILNVAGFASMGIDKWKAKKHAWRIPEATLFLIALLGGAIGSNLGMQLFRHKTKHWYFVYGMPAILILHIIIGVWVLKGPVQFSVF